MNILVTGAAGFIGSHVAKKLVEEGHKVIGIDNFNDYYSVQLKRDRVSNIVPEGTPVIEGDILDQKLLDDLAKEHSFDTIIHLAAQAGVRYSLENPDAYIQTNVQGTNNIFELARKHDIPKVIYASSSSVYGGNVKIPFKETDSVDSPVSIYAATKKANELQAQAYHALYGTTMIGLRFFTVYGPWGRPDMALDIFSRKMSKGEPIPVFNGGDMARGFTYIDDIAAGVVSCIGYEPENGTDIFNLSTENMVKLTDYISLIEKHMGITAKKDLLPMQKGDVKITYADISHAKEKLSYDPQYDVDKGIKNFALWFKEYYHFK
ncbi:MAG: NAD-dependent epimerase/dehydratase family protein [Nanoarchaeota archaeon]|nr:NAD-dependent epimerase/dehydratase family protein [Nanoarchaeota archaeon]